MADIGKLPPAHLAATAEDVVVVALLLLPAECVSLLPIDMPPRLAPRMDSVAVPMLRGFTLACTAAAEATVVRWRLGTAVPGDLTSQS